MCSKTARKQSGVISVAQGKYQLMHLLMVCCAKICNERIRRAGETAPKFLKNTLKRIGMNRGITSVEGLKEKKKHLSEFKAIKTDRVCG